MADECGVDIVRLEALDGSGLAVLHRCHPYVDVRRRRLLQQRGEIQGMEMLIRPLLCDRMSARPAKRRKRGSHTKALCPAVVGDINGLPPMLLDESVLRERVKESGEELAVPR